MGFTELSHAFIAAKYYVYLKEIFGDRGEAAFCHPILRRTAWTSDGTAGDPGRKTSDL